MIVPFALAPEKATSFRDRIISRGGFLSDKTRPMGSDKHVLALSDYLAPRLCSLSDKNRSMGSGRLRPCFIKLPRGYELWRNLPILRRKRATICGNVSIESALINAAT